LKVAQKGQEPDYSDWIVDLASFVAFAAGPRAWSKLPNNFMQLGASTDAHAPTISVLAKGETPNIKAPQKFVRPLIQLLVDIARRAAERGKAFDVLKMPGTKQDFLELAKKVDPELDKALRTFDDYVAGLIKFQHGAPSKEPIRFYVDLFPEYYKQPE
jgi:hypothetical protein